MKMRTTRYATMINAYTSCSLTIVIPWFVDKDCPYNTEKNASDRNDPGQERHPWIMKRTHIYLPSNLVLNSPLCDM
jgi:hypothetical protein